jgi:hypothetical protein
MRWWAVTMADRDPETPPPVPPTPDRRAHDPVLVEPPWPKTKMRHAVKAAFTKGPSRPQDQAVFWGITAGIEATKTLGFPIVVTFLVLFGGWKLINRSIDTQNVGQAHLTDAIKEMATAQTESNEITRALMSEVGLKAPPRRRPK